ncbi:MAG TPA: uracil-DNA glycosylase [Nitrospirota bacterium]|nr:uracil-DNA glycosylase [Nitrospirota bacterium]
MNKDLALKRIAEVIRACRLCKKGGLGKAVPGEGSADARIIFIGEAPGKEEAKTGRPFIGRSGKLLRKMIHEIGIDEAEVFITSPVHYLPSAGTPTKEMIIHGREHLLEQLSIIKPDIVVLLGNTACIAMLDLKIEISKRHGTLLKKDGRKYFITFHPAYAMRFPDGRRGFIRDFSELKKIIMASAS